MEDEKVALVRSLIDIVNEIASISDFRCTVKKQYCNLARRLKLLIPMFEEIRDIKEAVPEETLKALFSIKEALQSAKDLLRFGSEGSKIYLVRAFRESFCFLIALLRGFFRLWVIGVFLPAWLLGKCWKDRKYTVILIASAATGPSCY